MESLAVKFPPPPDEETASGLADPSSKGDALSAVQDLEATRARVAFRAERAKIKQLADPRPGKKLLVFDIDYTIFDLGSSAERPEELARPFLHEMMRFANDRWDLAIWSATSMRWVEVKMRELGVLAEDNGYQIRYLMDHASMVTVRTIDRPVYDCKPLEVIWRRFPEFYGPKNTLMIDDLRRNFVLNPQNGLTIRPYTHAHRNRNSDRQLLYLKHYLESIQDLEDLSQLNHDFWKMRIKPQIREIKRDERRRERANESEAPEGNDEAHQ